MITPLTRLETPFLPVPSVDITTFSNDQEKLNSYIYEHCVKQGTPIVFTNLQALPGWNKGLFDLKRTAELYGDKGIHIEKPEAPLVKKILPLSDYVDMIRSSPPSEETASDADSSKNSSPLLEPMSPSLTSSPASPSQPSSETSSQADDSVTPKVPHNKLKLDTKEAYVDAMVDEHFPSVSLYSDRVAEQPSMDNIETPISDVTLSENNDFVLDYLPGVQVTISERIQTGARRRKCREEDQQSHHEGQSKPKRHKIYQRQTTKGGIDRSLYYAKDIDCLDEYKECLHQILPPSLLPLGDTDLIRTLPSSLQAINLLCYLGGDRTGTALHCDISGAIGHNVMTYGDESSYAQWLVIKKGESQKLRELCQEASGNDDQKLQKRYQRKKSYFLECEQACVSPEQLTHHGIATHVIFQRPGDFVIIPSLCYHQVSNVGVSFKMAWNRITPHSLLEGIKLQLPVYRIIGRSELYRCKATVYFALKDILDNMPTKSALSSRTQRYTFLENCQILLHLFANDVILPEIIEPIPIENVDKKGIIDEEMDMTLDHHGFDVVCDFCLGDIFCRYYYCKKCVLDLCLDCYGMGRSCPHIDDLCMHESTLPGATQNSDKTMAGYIDLYKTVVDRLNSTFGPRSIVPDISSFYHRGDNYSLATTCRRIEMYRKKHKYLSNKFYCSHCDVVFDMKNLHSDLKSIFERRPCFRSLNSSPNSTVFVCAECSQKCLLCRPFIPHTRLDTELIYFRDIESSGTFWGGFEDTGIFQTACWPSYQVKVKSGDKNAKEKLNNRTWVYPEDFLSLAAAELIKHITPEGWKCWGSGDNTIPKLIKRLAHDWTNHYKKELKSGTISSGMIYKINTQKKRLRNNHINTAGLTIKIPSMEYTLRQQ